MVLLGDAEFVGFKEESAVIRHFHMVIPVLSSAPDFLKNESGFIFNRLIWGITNTAIF